MLNRLFLAVRAAAGRHRRLRRYRRMYGRAGAKQVQRAMRHLAANPPPITCTIGPDGRLIGLDGQPPRPVAVDDRRHP